MPCRVKVCGITSVENALDVCSTGVDAIGLVFYAKSSRFVTAEQAAEICSAIPPFVTTVGLFLNETEANVQKVLEHAPLDLLQFHGTESPEYCSGFNRPYIKAVPMKGLTDFAAYADQYAESKGFLVDSHAPGAAGGTGETFDWNELPKDYTSPIILAGGLNPENIAEAVETTGVYAVDVSSGVESKPGLKDISKTRLFMQEVRRVRH